MNNIFFFFFYFSAFYSNNDDHNKNDFTHIHTTTCTSTRFTRPSCFTTFIAYSRYMIARWVSSTVNVACVQTVTSKIASGTLFGKKYQICYLYYFLFNTTIYTNMFSFFFLIYMYLHLNFMIFKHVRYLHLSPLYPDEHPFKQFPLIKWHWSSRKQCPHSWRQLGPKVPVGHSYNAMNVILEYYSFWIVFIFCNKLLFKLNFNFFQNTNLNCFLCKKNKTIEWVYPVVIQKVH